MDAKGMMRYGAVTMRLLLLLSALFAALAGSSGARAAVSPVQASAMATGSVAAARSAVVAATDHPTARWSYRPGAMPPLVRIATPGGYPPLFAGRRRE